MGDVRRQFWNQGTKEQLFLVMEQVWLHVVPTSERIIENLEHLLDVVKKIIAHGTRTNTNPYDAKASAAG